MHNIFITGATGFLGSNLLREILAEEKNNTYVLTRAKDDESALARKNVLINQILPQSKWRKISSRINIVRGDITRDNFGLNKRNSEMLRDTIDTIYHCAASREFGYPINTIKKVNAKGTQNVLKMALDWKEKGHLENVNHISTAYVAGDYKGTFYEGQTDVSQNFNNTYEQSKFEAEMVVLRYRKKRIPIDIYRPSIITDSIRANTNVISGVLQLLVAFTLEIFEKIPIDNDTKLNMIPVDIASKAIYLISTTKNRPLNQNYHIVNPKPIKFSKLLNTASAFFRFKKPECVPLAKFRIRDLSSVQKKIIEAFVPYLNHDISFDMHNALSILKRHNFAIPRIGEKDLIETFKYYQSAGIISKRTGYVIKR